MKTATYDKAIAWIVREGCGSKIPRDAVRVAGWRIVQLTAALFDMRTRDVAEDVVDFAAAIHDGEKEEYP